MWFIEAMCITEIQWHEISDLFLVQKILTIKYFFSFIFVVVFETTSLKQHLWIVWSFLCQNLCIRLLHMHEIFYDFSLQVICSEWLAIRAWEFLQFLVPFPWSITQPSVCTPLLLSVLNSEVWDLWECRPLWPPALSSELCQVCWPKDVISLRILHKSF